MTPRRASFYHGSRVTKLRTTPSDASFLHHLPSGIVTDSPRVVFSLQLARVIEPIVTLIDVRPAVASPRPPRSTSSVLLTDARPRRSLARTPRARPPPRRDARDVPEPERARARRQRPLIRPSAGSTSPPTPSRPRGQGRRLRGCALDVLDAKRCVYMSSRD